MTPQFHTALIRAVVAAILTSASTFFSTAQGANYGDAALAAGAAFCTVLAIRGFGEGTLDSNRARRPHGQPIPAPTP